jgi:hypothetical protein
MGHLLLLKTIHYSLVISFKRLFYCYCSSYFVTIDFYHLRYHYCYSFGLRNVKSSYLWNLSFIRGFYIISFILFTFLQALIILLLVNKTSKMNHVIQILRILFFRPISFLHFYLSFTF